MTSPLKIIVSGPVQAGKTSFILSLSETGVMRACLPSGEAGNAFVALDFGTLTFGVSVSLYSTPGQDRFDGLWHTLCEKTEGFMLLVAGDAPDDFGQAKKMLDFATACKTVPYLIGVTRQDRPDSWQPEAVADYFGVRVSRVTSLNATRPSSCALALGKLLEAVRTQSYAPREELRLDNRYVVQGS
jgi:uncharacterized protein